MPRSSNETVTLLRDVLIRRRSGLPDPPGVDLDKLLEDPADRIEALERRINYGLPNSF